MLAIFVAAQFNNLDLMKYLMTVGSDPKVRLTDGSTCLLVAAERYEKKKKEVKRNKLKNKLKW